MYTLQLHRTNSTTYITAMPLTKKVVLTDKAPKPISVLNQGLVVGDMVYCSGQIGADPETGKLIEGTVQDRTVRWPSFLHS